MEPDHGHIPVLPAACLDALHPSAGQHVLDVTVGRGGHAALLIPHLGPGGRYTGLDTDPQNAAYATDRLRPVAAAHGVDLAIHHANFRELAPGHPALGDWPAVDGLLGDLGFASNQIAAEARGLSFKQDGPLDMRLDTSSPDAATAADLVNDLPQDDLANLIYRYGEERLSRRIARKIVEQRAAGPILTTGELARTVRAAYPRRPQGKARRPPGRGRQRDPKAAGKAAGRTTARSGPGRGLDPATRTFQALRIAVNGELDALDHLLDILPRLIRPGGRAALISFHSLEDRPIKRRFQQLEQAGLGQRLNRKPRIADGIEQHDNPRSRSAKLRAFSFEPQPGTASPPPPPWPPA